MPKVGTIVAKKRISFGVPESVHNVLSRAAASVGATVNQFVLHTALAEAHRVLNRETTIQLKQKDAELIISLMDDPPKPNHRLRKAVEVFQKTIRA